MTTGLFFWYVFLVTILVAIPYAYWRIIYIKKSVPKLIRWLSYFGVFTFTAAIVLVFSNMGYIGQYSLAFFIIISLLVHHNLLKHFSKKFNLDVVDKNDKENGDFKHLFTLKITASSMRHDTWNLMSLLI